MHIPIEHHRRVVRNLSAVILALLFLSALLVMQGGFFTRPTAYLQGEEAVVIQATTTEQKPVILPVQKVLFEYIEVTDGCSTHFEGICLNARSGPGAEFPSVAKLRNGIVLKVGGKVEREDGRIWYKVVFDEKLRYPERVTTDWYVSADYVKVLLDEGPLDSKGSLGSVSAKHIIVNRTTQTLTAYDGDTLFMEQAISTGLELTPTPTGVFTIYKKTPSRYMQGPVPGLSDQYYDLPGVPWDLYFTSDGAVIHGTYWHENFGKPASHGCVNLPVDQAEKLYNWAEVGTPVTVQD